MNSIVAVIITTIVAMPLAWFWIRKWQLALIGCVLFIPVSGYVAISFARHPVAIQAKDFFFLIPAYLGFAVFLKRKVRFSGIPRGFTLAVVALIGIVIFQLANPHPRSTEFTAKILGIKIWLFYLPLVMISYVFASTPENLRSFLRAIVVSSWIPSICGLLQFQLSRIYGFDKVMNFWFGSEAEAVSFNYGSFKTAGGEIFRIPATFTFATQYAYFLIGAFCFSLIAYDLEKDRNWKRFTLLTLLLLLAASVTSGTRALLFAIPLIPLAFLAIKRGVHSAIGAGIFLIVLNSVMAIATTFNPFEIAKSFAYLFQFYFTVWVPNAVKMAVLRYPLGAGTGSATHQARHLGQRIADNLIQNEGQYTKAIIELGIPGVVILIFLLLITPTVNFRNIFRTSDKNIKAICSSLLIYQGIIAVYCLKANPLDQDPTNMLYWISVGISYRVNSYLNFNESLNETQRAHVPALA